MTNLNRIRVSIFEEGKDYPVVVHLFYGETLQEAYGYYRAHMKTDAFLRACVTESKFGSMPCRHEQTTERWNGRRWAVT